MLLVWLAVGSFAPLSRPPGFWTLGATVALAVVLGLLGHRVEAGRIRREKDLARKLAEDIARADVLASGSDRQPDDRRGRRRERA